MKEKVKTILANKYVAFAVQVLAVILGSTIMGIAYCNFYVTTYGTITPSGFSGLSTVIAHFINVPPSIIYLVINILLFLIALKFFGIKFGILTLIGIFSYSLAMQYCIIQPLQQENLLLSALIGGALLGTGLGIVLRFGGSTGGSDIVVLLISKFSPKTREGQCTAVINLLIVILSVFAFGVDKALYAIIAIAIASRMTDTIMDGTKSARAYYIVCDKDEEIADEIMKTFHRGVTKIDVQGAFSQKKKKMLVVLVTNYQAPIMKGIVKQIEPESFVYSTRVGEAIGESMFLRQEAQQRVVTMKHIERAKLRFVEKKKDANGLTFRYFTSYPLRTTREEVLLKTKIKYTRYKIDG